MAEANPSLSSESERRTQRLVCFENVHGQMFIINVRESVMPANAADSSASGPSESPGRNPLHKENVRDDHVQQEFPRYFDFIIHRHYGGLVGEIKSDEVGPTSSFVSQQTESIAADVRWSIDPQNRLEAILNHLLSFPWQPAGRSDPALGQVRTTQRIPLKSISISDFLSHVDEKMADLSSSFSQSAALTHSVHLMYLSISVLHDFVESEATTPLFDLARPDMLAVLLFKHSRDNPMPVMKSLLSAPARNRHRKSRKANRKKRQENRIAKSRKKRIKTQRCCRVRHIHGICPEAEIDTQTSEKREDSRDPPTEIRGDEDSNADVIILHDVYPDINEENVDDGSPVDAKNNTTEVKSTRLRTDVFGDGPCTDDRHTNDHASKQNTIHDDTYEDNWKDRNVPAPYFHRKNGCHCEDEGSCKDDNDAMGEAGKVVHGEKTRSMNKTADQGSDSTAVIKDSGAENGLTSFASALREVLHVARNPVQQGPVITEKMMSKGLLMVSVSAQDEEDMATFFKSSTDENKADYKLKKKESKLKDHSKEKTIQGDEDESHTLEQYYDVWHIQPASRENFVFMLRAGQQLVHQGFESELRRLATFYNFCPPEGIYVIPLASAGFFLPARSSDCPGGADPRRMLLECAFCGVAVEVMRFVARRAMDVHKEVSPTCSLVRGQDSGNISVAQMAQTTGAQFLDSCSSATDRVPSPHAGAPSSSGQAVLLTDGDSRATSSAAIPAGYYNKGGAAEKLASLAPLHIASQQATVGFASTGKAAPIGQWLPGSGLQSDSRLGQTEADSRGIAPTEPALQTPAPPRQTATVEPPPQTTTTTSTPLATSDNTGSSSNTTQSSSSPSSNTESGSGQGSGSQERQVVTYEQLGIFAQRPKRQDMAVTATRINTFEAWPHADSHPSSQMAEAGFYYTGHADLVRCFYCKGGLKTWERSDKPWIEHARWFPRCPFVRLCKGQRFVDVIQKLNEAGGRPTITEADAKREMKRQEEEERRSRPSVAIPPSPAASEIQVDSAEGAVGGLAALRRDLAVGDGTDVRALSRRLEEENQEMKEMALCKVCQTNEVNVLFLPCGHLVACALCAPALRTCAICRQPVKGSVRVHLDEEESADI